MMSTPANNAEEPPVEATDNVETRTDFPCSVGQERFWLLDRLDPGNASYNVAVRWRLEGRVSIALLERAWLAIIERHEILRTVFLEVDGSPVQRILPQVPFRIAEIDLSTLSPDQQQLEGDRIGVIEARAPFDVGTGPLIRATLLRFSSAVSIILVTTHQIVSDGWSIGIMAREMGVIYHALKHDKPVPLEPLTIQYADFTLWQLEWLRVRGTAVETEYWTQQLAGVKPFKVIADHPRPPMQTTNGVIVSRVLPRELTNRAQALCATRGATLFAAALGALCAMLARYTREDEVTLGTQVSDRNQVELETMIGQFVNSLILRNDLRGDPRFTELIDRVRDTSAQALEHRNIPIERLLGMVKGEHGKANAPPISVNFIFQKTFIQNTAYTDFNLIDMPSLPAGAIYDLNFFMVERPDGWRFSLQYNTDQFEQATGNRLLAYFQNVLESAVLDPQRRLSELRLAAPDEARRLLGKLNEPDNFPRRSSTVYPLIEARLAAAPASIAILHEGREMSYAEFGSLIERLASGLRSRGIGLDSRIAICAEKSPELLGLVVALLKIGASSILLDPRNADEFLRRSAETAQVSAVATRGASRSMWTHSGVVVIDIDELLSARSEAKQLAAPAGVSLQTPAYVALPATRVDANHRVSISQGALASMLLDVGHRIGIATSDIVVAACPIGIDVAIAELLLPLVWGAAVVIATDKELSSPRAWSQMLKRSEATILHMLATTLTELHRLGWSVPTGLKILSSRGRVSQDLLQQIAQREAELWMFYGSAEHGIWASCSHVTSSARMNILGTPVGGASFSVSDRKNHSTEVGTVGELMIDQEQLAGARATGDLARLKADGNIEWLGRADRKLLHNGFLVDPADVENLLRSDPRVVDVLVAAGQQTFAGSLVACVALQESDARRSDAVVEDLRRSIEQSLPIAVVPIFIAATGALPLERDGSLNWRALPPGGESAAVARGKNPPLSGIEERLAQIWRDLLGIQDIDPSANFFELGGHSLLAARMLAQVNATFGRRVTLNVLFRSPSIRELARVIEQKDSREFDFRQMVRLQPAGSRPTLIAINNTGTYYQLAKCLGPDQPVISLQLFDPSLKTDAMPETLQQVAAGYVQLIQRVQPNGPYNLMGWCVAGALSFEIARQLTEAGKEVTSLYLMDSWVPRYIAKQRGLRRIVSDYSLRWQLVRADWRLMKSGGQSFQAFLNNRNGVKTLTNFWQRLRGVSRIDSLRNDEQLSREDYDKWLLHYLQTITTRYEPRPYRGKLTLFRSLEEPTGWFFDPLAGWGEYAASVELVMVVGDHFTMFQKQGAQQMATQITKTMAPFEPAKG